VIEGLWDVAPNVWPLSNVSFSTALGVMVIRKPTPGPETPRHQLQRVSDRVKTRTASVAAARRARWFTGIANRDCISGRLL